MSSDTIYTRIPYVYLIRHIPSGKFYAGSSYKKNCHPDQFWTSYFTSSKIVKGLIKEDGLNSFEVLEVIPRLLDDACQYEATFLKTVNAAQSDKWINKSNGRGEFYNCGPMTETTKAKMSEAKKGKPKSNEHRNSVSKTLTGHIVSEETKSKISKSRIGMTFTDTHKENISNSARGRKHKDSSKKITSEKLKGIVRSDATRAKMSAANKLRPTQTCNYCGKAGKGSGMVRWHFNNCKEKGH